MRIYNEIKDVTGFDRTCAFHHVITAAHFSSYHVTRMCCKTEIEGEPP